MLCSSQYCQAPQIFIAIAALPAPKTTGPDLPSGQPFSSPAIGPVSTQLSCGSLLSKGPLSCCSLPCAASPLSSVLLRSSCASCLAQAGTRGCRLPEAWQGLVMQVTEGWGLPGHSTPHPRDSPTVLAVMAPCSARAVHTYPSAGHATALERCAWRLHNAFAEQIIPRKSPPHSKVAIALHLTQHLFYLTPRRFNRSQAHQAQEGSGVRTSSLSHKVFKLPLPGNLLPANLHSAPRQVGLWDQGRCSQSAAQSRASKQPWGTSLPPSYGISVRKGCSDCHWAWGSHLQVERVNSGVHFHMN